MSTRVTNATIAPGFAWRVLDPIVNQGAELAVHGNLIDSFSLPVRNRADTCWHALDKVRLPDHQKPHKQA